MKIYVFLLLICFSGVVFSQEERASSRSAQELKRFKNQKYFVPRGQQKQMQDQDDASETEYEAPRDATLKGVPTVYIMANGQSLDIPFNIQKIIASNREYWMTREFQNFRKNATEAFGN